LTPHQGIVKSLGFQGGKDLTLPARRVLFFTVLQVKEHRQARDLPIEGLAYLSGLTYKTITRVERTRSASSKTLIAIAEALEVEVGDLFKAPKKNGRKRRAS
jgi:transcriptional regulator with XRE-family HTH domain